MPATEAIILAGGLGTRLRDAVPGLPKCMAPINGTPFIGFVLHHLQQQGITHFIFSLGYRSDAFTEYLTGLLPEASFQLVVEPEPLGTGGAIRFAIQHATTSDIVVVNGDSIFKNDIDKQYQLHVAQQADCTLALKPMQQFSRYGRVEIFANGSIQSFTEKAYCEEGLINGGVYLLNKKKFESEPLPDKFSFETDYLQAYYPSRKILGVVDKGYFIDIGIPEDYLIAQKELKL